MSEERRQQITKRLEENKILADGILKRFCKYVTFDTQSNEAFIEERKPSTPGQMVLAENMKKELEELGISDVSLDEHGFVIARIPATAGLESKKSVCFVAHMDTAQEVSGKDVKPQIHSNYDLSPIILNNNIIIDIENTPHLKECPGETIISGDGTTLLGGDDKAGIANIMSAFDYILNISKIPHGPLEIMFNCDEELGGGTLFFKPEMLKSRIAYTIDGAEEGQVEYETFNAAQAVLHFHGDLLRGPDMPEDAPQDRPDQQRHHAGQHQPDARGGNLQVIVQGFGRLHRLQAFLTEQFGFRLFAHRSQPLPAKI